MTASELAMVTEDEMAATPDHSRMSLAALEQRIAPLRERLALHPVYRSIQTIEDVHIFLETHVFAVWDFMSLLKALQRGLTTVEVPWRPSALPEARRFINEIVLGEESDLYNGEAISHFELYCRAMTQCGASTQQIEALLAEISRGAPINDALDRVAVPAAAHAFVEATFRFIASAEMHVIAAAFTFGREDLIPAIFRAFLRDQDERLSGRLALLRWYLDRHIEVDGDEHGPMSLRMVAALCGTDATKWEQAETAAVDALEARLALWDGITAAISARGERQSQTAVNVVLNPQAAG